MERFDIRPRGYVLVVPGGGASHPGTENVLAIIAAAARGIARRGYTTVLVGLSQNDSGTDAHNLRLVPRLPMEQLCELIRGARMVISNGGDTLLQVLASRRPCLAVPLAGDQAHRIACCVKAGILVGARRDAHALESDAVSLLENKQWQGELERRFGQCEIADDMDVAVDALITLISRA
jgi:UDP:flavonoid glycosyltransferase YjiC (YdhE family)